MKPILIAIFSLVFAHFALAAPGDSPDHWTDESVAVGQRWNTDAALFPNTFEASVWGALHAEQKDVSDEDIRYSSVYLRTDYYGKKLPAYLMTQKINHSPFMKTAPLMVMMPGIFSTALDENEMANAQGFYRQGYHVLIVPNPWGADAIGHKPQYMPGNIEAEGKSLLASIQAALAHELGHGRLVSSVSLYGESYGSLIVGIAAGLDDATDPIITGKVYIASPPLDISKAYRKLDLIFDESASEHEYCQSKFLRVGLNFLHAKSEQNLSQDSVECAESLVSVGFRTQLGEAMAALEKTDLDFPRDEPYQVSFSYYVSHLAPAMEAYCYTADGICTLNYWIGQALKHGKTRINIVASQDDFLNSPSDWDAIRKTLPDPAHQLILFNWGGHLGYYGSKLYTDALYQN